MIEINVMQVHIDGQIYESKMDEGATLKEAAQGLYENLNELSKLNVPLIDGSWLLLNKSAIQRCHIHFTTSLISEESNNRIDAMGWWHERSSAQKTKICDLNTEMLGSVRRWETLTGREIEKLYNDPNVRNSV